ncbi:hypothetical protein [Rhodococcus opacus]|uniref:hypothetical protein n=1 Tax=Rhodococcus opacus TaxID=37919 RepID=UPI001C492A89|nr:hypothetical protein [Rhodococcus opacus]MBV6758401.1 hypothetical protein [Rhodococcus opacus]
MTAFTAEQYRTAAAVVREIWPSHLYRADLLDARADRLEEQTAAHHANAYVDELAQLYRTTVSEHAPRPIRPWKSESPAMQAANHAAIRAVFEKLLTDHRMKSREVALILTTK